VKLHALYDHCLRWLLMTVVAIYIVAALYFSVGRFYMPQLEKLAPAMISALQQSTNLHWRVSGLRGDWRKLDPVFYVDHLTAYANPDGDGEPLLSLQQTELQLDVIASLLARQWRVAGIRSEQLKIILPSFDEQRRQLPEGFSAALRSFSLPAAFASDPAAVPSLPWPRWTQRFRYLELERIEARRLDSAGVVAAEFPAVTLRLTGGGDKRQLHLFQSDSSSGAFSLRLDSEGPLMAGSGAIDAYIEAREFDAAPWLDLFDSPWRASHWSGQLWLSRSPQQSWRVVAAIEQGQLQHLDAPSYRFDALSTRLAAQVDAQGTVDIGWSQLSARWRDQAMTVPSTALRFRRGDTSLSDLVINMSQLDLAHASAWLSGGTLLNTDQRQLLETLNPRGLLRQLQLVLPDLERWREARLTARLASVAIDPWRTAPGVSGINGRVRLDRHGGVLDLASESPLSLSFPHLYSQALYFGRAEGAVDWSLQGDRLWVSAENLQLRSATAEGQLAARFFLNARRRPADEASYLSLQIGVSDVPAESLQAYLPRTVSASLHGWLGGSELQGRVIDGGFVYNGSLQRGAVAHRSNQLYFNVADASLRFHPQWPLLSAVDGLVEVVDSNTRVRALGSDALGLALSHIDVALQRQQRGTWLSVDAAFEGGLDNALQLLQQSPLKTPLSVLGSWRGEGELRNGRLRLRLPLGSGANSYFAMSSADTAIDFHADIVDGGLQLHNLALALENISGPLAYSRSGGLLSEGITATLWQRPISIVMGDYRGVTPSPGADYRIDIATAVAADDLYHWLRQPLFSLFDGESSVALRIEQCAGRTEISADSDLLGMAIDLPRGLYKPAAEAMPLQLRWHAASAEQPMHIVLADKAKATLHFDRFRFSGGALTVNDSDRSLSSLVERNAPSVADGILRISGEISHLDIAQWTPLFERYQRAAEAFPIDGHAAGGEHLAAAAESSLAVSLADFQLGRVEAFGRVFSSTRLSANFLDRRWRFTLDNDKLQGSVSLPVVDVSSGVSQSTDSLPVSAENFPWDERYLLSLSFLRLEKTDWQGQGEGSSPWQPRDLLPLAIEVDQLQLADQPLGSWKFLLTPSENVALLHDIRAQYFQLNLSSAESDGLLWGVSDRGEVLSRLSLTAQSADIAGFMHSLSNDRSQQMPFESAESTLEVDFHWAGWPDEFSISGSEGRIAFRFDDGRFLRTSGSAEGLLKVVGLINFDTWLRRMQLDFSDLYQDGLSFDSVEGELALSENIFSFVEVPIKVNTPSSRFSLSGQLALQGLAIDADLVATLPVANNLPWMVGLAGGLPAAAGAFVVGRVFEKELDRLSSAVYIVDGSLEDPAIRFDHLFDDGRATGESERESVPSVVNPDP